MNRKRARNSISAKCLRATGIALAIAGVLLLTNHPAVHGLAARAEQQYSPTYSVLYSFTGGADGGDPEGGLIADADGNLYGTARSGGNSARGVIFKLDQAGKETVLHSFAGPDGANPTAALIRDAAGNFYGTTLLGGVLGDGTVFKLAPSGKETLLHSFTGGLIGGTDGAEPYAGLIRDAAGNFYGTTTVGGNLNCISPGPLGCGVVFKLDPSGQETLLYTFSGGTDGSSPAGSLVQDAAGNLYGTANIGGDASAPCVPSGIGCGVVFKLDQTGNETVLLSFTWANGAFPDAGLLRDGAGNLYGTTVNGTKYVAGEVFILNAAGNSKVAHAFTGGADGGSPLAGLVRDSAGNLYGATSGGGITSGLCSPGGCGVVFKLDPAGHETVLYTFTGGTDGSSPVAALLLDSGALYGTTTAGGVYGQGVVFKITLQ